VLVKIKTDEQEPEKDLQHRIVKVKVKFKHRVEDQIVGCTDKLHIFKLRKYDTRFIRATRE
jgi:hypothetical protein